MFVMLYFMHLKFEGKWKYVLLAPTMVLALAIIAALTPDIGLHYYDVQVPQQKVSATAHGHGPSAESGDAGHH
jgi:cytochrome c oxidase subunit IV